MTPDEQIYSLMAVAEEQQKSLAASSAASVAAITASIASLERSRRQFETSLTAATQQGVQNGLTGASAETQKALSTGAAVLADAADRADHAAASLGWKTTLTVAVSCLAVVLGGFLTLYVLTPSIEEITSLRADKAALEANIGAMVKRGGRMKLQTCEKRLCVEIDEEAGSFGEKGRANYRVLKGY